jgi:aspartyl aminopeptidase
LLSILKPVEWQGATFDLILFVFITKRPCPTIKDLDITETLEFEMPSKKAVTQDELNKGLMSFIENSPTPFHAVSNLEMELKKNGYKQLLEVERWSLKSGGKYFVKRNESSLIAFKLTKGDSVADGLRIVGAHTDSPALKVKPNSEKRYQNYLQFAVEPYGGLLLSTWFDRDLSLAGRVTYLSKKKTIDSVLVDFKRPIATVPSLAIHLNRSANENRTINKQSELPPLLMQVKAKGKVVSLSDLLLKELKSKKLAGDCQKILDHELFFYDTQRPAVVGLEEDFIATARLDNLASCYLGLRGMFNSGDKVTSLLVCNDHEECGSNSTTGAGGSFLKDVIERITGDSEGFKIAVARSMLISADNAHAVHPNYADKHESNHLPVINGGPVIKINANQRYATSSETSAIFQYLAGKVRVPFQKFVTRSDLACGSTIGPITSTLLGIKTLDVGLPTFGMHSIRELGGVKDPFYLYKILVEFFKESKAY